jgi:hypothetical protein
MKKRIIALGASVAFIASFGVTEIILQANKPPVFPRPVVTARDYERRLEGLQLAYEAAKTEQDKALIRDMVRNAVAPDDVGSMQPQFKKFYNETQGG